MPVRMEMEMKGRRKRDGFRDRKVNTKAVKILKVLSVSIIVMAQWCEEGRIGWRMGWRGF